MSTRKSGTSRSAEEIALGISGVLGNRPWAAVYEDDGGTPRLASAADQDPAKTYRLFSDAAGTLETG